MGDLLPSDLIMNHLRDDDAVGRVLDRLYEVGTSKVLAAVALRAVKLFDLDTPPTFPTIPRLTACMGIMTCMEEMLRISPS
jgi:hypothetical protein